MKTKLCLNLILFLLAVLSPSPGLSQEVWTPLENGLLRLNTESLSKKPLNQLIVVKILPRKHGIKVFRAQDFGKKTMTASEVCQATGALLCINASFFDEKYNPLGLVISSGVSFQKVHQGGDTLTGVFFAARKSFGIVERSNFDNSLMLEAIQAGPRLIIAGRAVQNIKDRNLSRRSGVCLDREGSVVFFVTREDAQASSLAELAEAMLDPMISCQEGLNLDGGGSSQLYLRASQGKAIGKDEIITESLGHDKAPVFLGVIEGIGF